MSIAAPRCAQTDIDAFSKTAGSVDLRLFPSFGTGGFATSAPLVRWVKQVAAGYDVIHVHGLFNPTSSFSAAAAIGTSTPTVIRPFGTLSRYTFEHRRTALKSVWFNRVERQNLNAARAIHFTTDREREEAAWHGLDFSNRSHVIPPPSLDQRTAGESTEPRSDDGIVLFIGRINPIKNLEALIDAWPIVRAKASDLLLEIVGDGDPAYVSTLRQRVSRIGVDSSVVFRGFLGGEAKQRVLSGARMFVLPSHHENFGIAALEAVSAGLPVVLSRNVQLADFVMREQLGKISDTTPNALAESILAVSRDNSLLDRVHTRGPQVVSANFSPATIGQLLSQMYLAATE